MPTKIVDRASDKMPFFYWSVRTNMLLITIVSFLLWPLTGFNVAEGWVPIIGIQWSTFSTFGLFFYLMMVNLQYGGLKNLQELKSEIKYDLKAIIPALVHPKTARRLYHRGEMVDGLRAATMSLCVCIAALFLFECIWVPLYDYFQFGSWEWPVYFAQRTSSLWLTPVFDRNMLDFGLVLGFGIMVLSLAYDYGGSSPFATFWHRTENSAEFMERRFNYNFRFDRYWAFILILTAGMWVLWIYFPHQPIVTSQLASSQVLGQSAKTFSASACYIFPSQHLFPQNTYTFYPCFTYLKPYPISLILGFFNGDNWLHLVNVLTKYITFLGVCYPFMARVRRNGI